MLVGGFVTGAEAGEFVAELVDDAVGHGGSEQGRRPGFFLDFETQGVAVEFFEVGAMLVWFRRGYFEPVPVDIFAAGYGARS